MLFDLWTQANRDHISDVGPRRFLSAMDLVRIHTYTGNMHGFEKSESINKIGNIDDEGGHLIT
jgi:hypothetical protein